MAAALTGWQASTVWALAALLELPTEPWSQAQVELAQRVSLVARLMEPIQG